MPIRQDIQQLIINIDAKESAEYKKSLDRSKDLNRTIKNAEAGTEEYNNALKEQIELNRKLQSTDFSKQSLKNIQDRRKQLIELQRILPQVTFAEAGFEKELRDVNNAMKEAIGRTRATGESMGFLQKTLGRVGPAIVAAFAFDKVKDFFGAIIRGSSEVEAIQNRFETVFGDSADAVQQYADDTAISLGLTVEEYKKVAAASGDLLVPIGFQREAAALLSKDVIELSSALSQWEGGTRSTEEITKILNKALLGEREQLKELGVAINEADVKTRLAAKGQDQLTGNALKQAKALATLEIITENSSDAITAFTDRQDSAAQVLARGSALVRTYWDRLVKFVIPVVSVVLGAVEGLFNNLVRGEQATGRFGTAINVVAGILRIAGNVVIFIGKQLYNLALFIGDVISSARNLPVVGTIINAIGTALNGIVQVLANSRQYWAGFSAAATQAVENVKRGIEVLLINLKIFAKEAQQLVTFGDADARLEAEINALKSKREDLRSQGKSLGQAFADGYKEEIVKINSQQNSNRSTQLTFGGNTQILTPNINDQTETGNKREARSLLPNIAALPSLSPANSIGGINEESIRSDAEARLEALEDELDRELLLREKQFINRLITEQEYELASEELALSNTENKLRALEIAGLSETQLYRDIEREKISIQQARIDKEIENEQRLIEVKKATRNIAFEHFKGSIALGIELLGKDEEARKKNASAIKAFETAKILTDSFSEISGIHKSVAGLGPAAWIFGAIRAGIVAARASAQIATIRSQKFERGGGLQDLFNYGGLFEGPSHRAGGIRFGVNGQNVETEGDEVIINKRSSNLFRGLLSDINSYNGWGVKFARGGAVNPVSTPTALQNSSAVPNQSDAANAVMNKLNAAVDRLVSVLSGGIDARVNYSSLERASGDVSRIRELGKFA